MRWERKRDEKVRLNGRLLGTRDGNGGFLGVLRKWWKGYRNIPIKEEGTRI